VTEVSKKVMARSVLRVGAMGTILFDDASLGRFSSDGVRRLWRGNLAFAFEQGKILKLGLPVSSSARLGT
jgi:hypothetical protein